MKANPIQRRLTRLQRECEVSVAPALLLAATCALVFLLEVDAVTADASPMQAQAQHLVPEQQPE